MDIKEFKNYTILIVDDDINILNVYKNLLSLFFKEVYTATNGEEGLEVFKKNRPDIVLSDFRMPKLNGLEMAEEILKIEKVPIILITAFDDKDILKGAISKNITAFVQKPIQKEELFSALNKALEVLKEKKRVKKQEEIIKYKNYQEYLAYEKEKLILKKENPNIEVFYKPLEITSGDTFSVREKIFFLADAMGKGISASVTSMMATSFFNYLVDKDYDFERIVFEFVEYMKKRLLDDEIFCFGIYCLKDDRLFYSTFGLPPFLYQKDSEVNEVKSNNLFLTVYLKNYKIDSLKLDDVNKMIFYTDGLNENLTKDNKIYNNYLPKDFLISNSLNEFEKLREEKVPFQEDDVTYLFMKK